MKKLTDKIIETAANVVEDNNKIFDSLETERMTLVREIAGSVIQYMNDFVADRKLNEEEKNMLVQTIIDDLNNEFEENGHLSDEPNSNSMDQMIETGYGTSHLEQQGAILGNILTTADELEEGQMYCIVDLGMNEWNSGYKYLGFKPFEVENTVDLYHQFQNTLDQHQLGEPDMYTKEESNEMIENAQIASEL